jgi:hypothetical protein
MSDQIFNSVCKMFDKCIGNWREISTLFETYFAHCFCYKIIDKMSTICTHFFIFIDCEIKIINLKIYFHDFWDFFLHVGRALLLQTKLVTKCLQFVYFFENFLIVKCLTKFKILPVKCLTNV